MNSIHHSIEHIGGGFMYDTRKETEQYPGFYEIPGFQNYAVSYEGEVVNKISGKIIAGSTNPKGYHNHRLSQNNGRTLTIGRHRLMMLAFKYPGEIVDSLWVNHKNGIRGDDRLDNLEWVTPQGNCHHAGLTGLTSKCCPISVRDVDTGVVLKFPSIIDCATHFGLSKDAIRYRIWAGEERIFPERKQYRASHSGDPWYIPEKIELEFVRFGHAKRAYVYHLLTKEIRMFVRLIDLADHLGIKPSTLTQWMKFKGQPVLPGFVLLKWSHDTTPWRQVEDPYLELASTSRNHRPVKTTEEETGAIKLYTSVQECAKYHGLNQTTLHYRLKSNGNTVFSDGYRYEYYSSNSNQLCPTD